MKSFRLIGLMSGTSLDGLDIADVKFYESEDGSWLFELVSSQTFDYSTGLKDRLFEAPNFSSEKLSLLSVELSQMYGDKINEFISTNDIDKNSIYAISSHGQTIFHQPENSMTMQIGNTPHLAIKTGIKTIVDFRTKDVALGGNGAPLIPIVDHMLFEKEADGFLNLGGFSNLSFKENGVVRSFDVGPVNIVINYLVKERGLSMDNNGEIARSGKMDNSLFERLNALDYYNNDGPKSLGWEWVRNEVIPLFDSTMSLENKLFTFVSHVTFQLKRSLEKANVSSVMITGGGAHNLFLIEQLEKEFSGVVIIPTKEIVDFKEAIGFAFLGLLRCLNQVNVLCSVTGAQKDSCSGVVYEP